MEVAILFDAVCRLFVSCFVFVFVFGSHTVLRLRCYSLFHFFTLPRRLLFHCLQLQVKLQNTDETVGELLPLMDRTTRLEAHSRYDAVRFFCVYIFLNIHSYTVFLGE